VEQINSRFQRLGDHVFDDEGRLRPGLLVAINDEVTSRRDRTPRIAPGDEVFLFTQIAGG
jgi:sulfur transfer ThiS family protein